MAKLIIATDTQDVLATVTGVTRVSCGQLPSDGPLSPQEPDAGPGTVDPATVHADNSPTLSPVGRSRTLPSDTKTTPNTARRRLSLFNLNSVLKSPKSPKEASPSIPTPRANGRPPPLPKFRPLPPKPEASPISLAPINTSSLRNKNDTRSSSDLPGWAVETMVPPSPVSRLVTSHNDPSVVPVSPISPKEGRTSSISSYASLASNAKANTRSLRRRLSILTLSPLKASLTGDYPPSPKTVVVPAVPQLTSTQQEAPAPSTNGYPAQSSESESKRIPLSPKTASSRTTRTNDYPFDDQPESSSRLSRWVAAMAPLSPLGDMARRRPLPTPKRSDDSLSQSTESTAEESKPIWVHGDKSSASQVEVGPQRLPSGLSTVRESSPQDKPPALPNVPLPPQTSTMLQPTLPLPGTHHQPRAPNVNYLPVQFSQSEPNLPLPTFPSGSSQVYDSENSLTPRSSSRFSGWSGRTTPDVDSSGSLRKMHRMGFHGSVDSISSLMKSTRRDTIISKDCKVDVEEPWSVGRIQKIRVKVSKTITS